MTKLDNIMDKVDPDLLKLIKANDDFRIYRGLATTTNSMHNVSIKGSLGVEINPNRPLGLSFSSRS